MNRTLLNEPLPSYLWRKEHTILQLKIWKEDNGTLPPGMSKLQRTKEKPHKRSRNTKDASGKTTRRPKDDKARPKATGRLES